MCLCGSCHDRRQGKKKAPGSKPCFLFNGGEDWDRDANLAAFKSILLGTSTVGA